MGLSIHPGIRRALLPHVVATAFLLVAIPWEGSSGYFSVLRWVVCAAFVFLAIEAHGLKKERWTWIWGVLAGIYNPIIPVNASRDLWAAVDLIAIGFLLFDLLIKHESLAGFRNFVKAASFWLLNTAIRLALACAILVALFFALNFVITRWG